MKLPDAMLCDIISMANSLRSWVRMFTNGQKYAIQEARDALQDVVDKVEGENDP